jgi:phage baseplate assembly protein W
MAKINRASRRYTDINLMFSPQPYTKDISTLSNEDAVKASIKNLVLTNNYERLFHPEIGCQVNSLLFENLDGPTLAAVQYTIQNTLDKFEPRASITDITVTDDSAVNAISIQITFILNNTTQPITVTTTLNRLR